jgi:hypothetical protein
MIELSFGGLMLSSDSLTGQHTHYDSFAGLC